MSYTDILPEPSILKVVDIKKKEINKLYQWDIDKELFLENWEEITDEYNKLFCYFFHKGDKSAALMRPQLKEINGEDRLIVRVPNSLLQDRKEIHMFVVLEDQANYEEEDEDNIEKKTVFATHFTVFPKSKPYDYDYKDNVDYVSLKDLEEEVSELVDYIHTAIEDGDLRGPEGPQGPVGPQGPIGPQGTTDYYDLINKPRELFIPTKEYYLWTELPSGIYDVAESFKIVFDGTVDKPTNSVGVVAGGLIACRNEKTSVVNHIHGIIIGAGLNRRISSITFEKHSGQDGYDSQDLATLPTSLKKFQSKISRYNLNNGDIYTLQDNAEYYGENILTLTLGYPVVNETVQDFECFIRLTFAEEGTITFSLPSISKYIGQKPQFQNGETWELSIKDGVVIGGKVE